MPDDGLLDRDVLLFFEIEKLSYVWRKSNDVFLSS